MLSKLLVALILYIHLTADCVLLNHLVDRDESEDCPTLCDRNLHIDAITGINLTPELLLVSGECAFIVDPTKPANSQKRRGFKHLLPFSDIQDMFAIGNNTDIEFVSVYASGTIVQVVVANSTDVEQNFAGSNVFEGLSVDLAVPIDAAFAWSDQRIVYLFQGSKYWAYSMSRGWKQGGRALQSYPRHISDFGLSADRPITSAFADSTKIYFLSLDLVYVYDITGIDSDTGVFKGSLSQASIKLKDFLRCPAVVDESDNGWFMSFKSFFVDIPQIVNDNGDLLFLLIALFVLCASLVFLFFSVMRYYKIVAHIRGKTLPN